MSNIATITPTVQVMLDAKVKADLLAGRIAATDWDAQFSQYLAEYAAQIEANLGFFVDLAQTVKGNPESHTGTSAKGNPTWSLQRLGVVIDGKRHMVNVTIAQTPDLKSAK
jgi:hypothetical protein